MLNASLELYYYFDRESFFFLNPHIRLQNTFKRNKGCKNNHQLCYPCTNIPQTKIDPYPYANTFHCSIWTLV